MNELQSLFSDILLGLTTISWPQILDLGMVTLIYYGLLQLIRRSQVASMLRGALMVVAISFVIILFLPLRTFTWVIRIVLLALLVATPVILQPELRRLFERVGQSIGTISFRQTVAETALMPIVRAVGALSENFTGALIVIEGRDELEGVLQTGVPLGSEVTSELLQTIFYDGTPLHDGALVIRQDRVVAAGCVLPVSNRQLYAGQRRLGTRHRAAVGLTEVYDALAVVVSEETGAVSVAKDGQLHARLDTPALREHIVHFYQPETSEDSDLSLPSLWQKVTAYFRQESALPAPRRWLDNLSIVVIALLLALGTWALVLRQTNPATEGRIENIPLRVEGIPAGTTLMSNPPDTVDARIQTTDELFPTLGATSFQATISLEELDPGLHRLQPVVETGVSPVRILSVEPPLLDLELAEIISRTMPVRVEMQGEDALSPALEVTDTPTVTPTQVTVTGAAPQVESVVRVQAEMSVAEAGGALQQTIPLQALDGNGNVVENVTIEPEQAQVQVQVVRRADAREVGISVPTAGQPPAGYRVSRIIATPSQVILIGDPDLLDEIGSAITTVPVDVSVATDDLSIQQPLELPANVEAVDNRGETVRTVLVRVEIEVQRGNLTLTRPVEILGSPGIEVDLNPQVVDLLLSGPVPTLDEIEADPTLVRVLIDAIELVDLEAGQTLAIIPTVAKPDDVNVELVPETIQVTTQEE